MARAQTPPEPSNSDPNPKPQPQITLVAHWIYIDLVITDASLITPASNARRGSPEPVRVPLPLRLAGSTQARPPGSEWRGGKSPTMRIPMTSCSRVDGVKNLGAAKENRESMVRASYRQRCMRERRRGINRSKRKEQCIINISNQAPI